MAGTNTNPSPGRRPGRPKSRPQAGEPAPEIACRDYEARLDPASRRLVQRALKVLERRAFYRGVQLSSPGAVRDLLTLRFAGLEREEFRAIWLDAQNCIIADELLFSGTLTQTSVYPREVVKAALALNAAAVIFAHNHPSGDSTPSLADEQLTSALNRPWPWWISAAWIISWWGTGRPFPLPKEDCCNAVSLRQLCIENTMRYPYNVQV